MHLFLTAGYSKKKKKTKKLQVTSLDLGRWDSTAGQQWHSLRGQTTWIQIPGTKSLWALVSYIWKVRTIIESWGCWENSTS